ncbi:hypothetical protein METHP14_340026 [Pseudomonas sp. P14-2025]
MDGTGFARVRGRARSHSVRAISQIFIASVDQAPWHFLYFFSLPHGHGSLRPTSFRALRTGSWWPWLQCGPCTWPWSWW